MSAGSAARTRVRMSPATAAAWSSRSATSGPEGSGPFASHRHTIRLTLLPAAP